MENFREGAIAEKKRPSTSNRRREERDRGLKNFSAILSRTKPDEK